MTHHPLRPSPPLAASRTAHTPRGFFALETAWSLGLALFLLMLMSAMIARQNKAEQKLAQIRNATRATESALLQLQAGDLIPADEFKIERFATPAPPGHMWIRINNDLVGLVPIPGGTP